MDETEYIMSSPNRYQLAPIHAWGTTAFRKKDVENAIAKYNEEQGKAQQEAYYTCFDIMQKYLFYFFLIVNSTFCIPRL